MYVLSIVVGHPGNLFLVAAHRFQLSHVVFSKKGLRGLKFIILSSLNASLQPRAHGFSVFT